MAETETAIAVTNNVVEKWLQENKDELQQFAARKYNGDSWLKTALLAIIESDTCMSAMQTQSGRVSLNNALRRAASLGLSLNPVKG